MFALLPELVTGGINLIGDMISQGNARSAFKHRYQDTVADQRAAGLNPALAYGQGGGNPQTSDFGDIGSSAAQAGQAIANKRLTDAQANLLKRQSDDLALTTMFRRDQANWESGTAKFRNEIEGNRAGLSSQLYPEAVAKYRAQSAKAVSDAEAARLGLPRARAYGKYYQGPIGRNEPYINAAEGAVSSAVGAYKNIKGANKPPYRNQRRYP